MSARKGLALITRTLGEFLPVDDEILRMKAFQMMSSLSLILLVGQETGAVIGLKFTNSGFTFSLHSNNRAINVITAVRKSNCTERCAVDQSLKTDTE